MPTSLQQGINAAKAGQTEEALEHLKDAIIEEPQNADVWVWIAAIIDDLEKQEIFLKKALEINPHNIPAQRGLSYLQNRKGQDNQVVSQALADHTQPISPFPKADGVNQDSQEIGPEAPLASNDPLNFARQSGGEGPNAMPGEANLAPQRLTPLEIILLAVVVVVFTFIGLLASSAIFDFDLPWGLLTGNRPTLSADPPYPGVFLYDDKIFYDIQAHEGPPVADVGIPASSSSRPVAVFWQTNVDISSLKLLHESGTYINHAAYNSRSKAVLIQPSADLENGLYCLQVLRQQPLTNIDTYYCFRVDLLFGE